MLDAEYAGSHPTPSETREVPVLAAERITRAFGGVQALDGADFDVLAGEVVALIGDNGAGKSTLVKALTGNLDLDSGRILLDGVPVHFAGPAEAVAAGIEVVHQDLSLAPHLDPVANVYLGREVRAKGLMGLLGFMDHKTMRAHTAQVLADLGGTVRVLNDPVANMSGGQRQQIAIARAIAWAGRVVFLDEPTAALGVVQTRNVLDAIRRVRDSGVAVVLISHSMPEVLEVADRVQVLRLGRRVATYDAASTSIEELVGAMTGALDAPNPKELSA